jgi:anaerobic nitric oxide reductase flavorubredoxin
MAAIEVRPGVWWVGVNVRSHDLFEGLWPLPHGVSLNSYLVKGDHCALIDVVREWSGSSGDFLDQLDSTGIKPSDIDYIILNHLEPDHTGFLHDFRLLAPNAKILATPRGVELVAHMCHIQSGVESVQDGQELDLGAGKKLIFHHTPFVHWPETMMTYLPSDKVLFSCDAFGGFGVLKGILFDDQVHPDDWSMYSSEMLRYYANIVANFSRNVVLAIQKVGGNDIEIVAPSHGLVWRRDPGKVIADYQRFARYAAGQAERGVTLLWASMYGKTKAATDAIMRGIAREGVCMEVFEVPHAAESFVLASIFKNRGVVVGAPTYEVGLFPPMAHLLDSVARKHMTNRKALRFGSYGWSGGAQKEFDALAERLQWTQAPPLEFRGSPTPEQLQHAEDAAASFARSIRDED